MHFLARGLDRLDRGRVGVAYDDDVAHRYQFRHKFVEQRQQRRIDNDDEILGVVGDVDHLVGGQPDVQRMEHGTHRWDGEIYLEVLLVVPHEGRDPLVCVHAEIAERVREPGRICPDVGVRRAPDTVRGQSRDATRAPVDRTAVPGDGGGGERRVEHGATHDDLLDQLDQNDRIDHTGDLGSFYR